MALTITNPETEKNIRALAAAMGEPIDEAVNKAALERLKLVPVKKDDPQLMEKIYALLKRVDALPRLDHRTADEIIGYDEDGLPT
jgi:antitoxin VapB